MRKNIFFASLIGLLMVLLLRDVWNNLEQAFPSHLLSLIERHNLPSELRECSGLEISPNNEFWVHNDKGNEAILYAVDSLGRPLRSMYFLNVENNDWEDLTQDEHGQLYIGDFGNNDNDRSNLAIYVIPPPDGITARSYSPEVIYFYFEDQSKFPPPKSGFFFDVEAFFAANGKLYLFTKDRSKPFKGITKLYEIPSSPGMHKANLVSSFKTHTKKSKGAITGADISPDGKTIALISKDIVWVSKDFTAPDYLSGSFTQYILPEKLQTEAITFKDNCIIYVANEKNGKSGPLLQRFSICKQLTPHVDASSTH